MSGIEEAKLKSSETPRAFLARLCWVPLTQAIEGLGDFARMVSSVFGWMCRPPYRVHLLLAQLDAIGLQSLPIVLLVGLFTGMVFSLQAGHSFATFNAETLVGGTVAISLTREIGPVFAALVLISRTGSAMAAEIASMTASEQLDAMQMMSVSPIQYLVVPRVIASAMVYPLLTGLFDVMGAIGAYIVGIHLLAIPEGPFLDRMYQMVDPSDLWGGLLKATIFGALVALICGYQGLKTSGGAAGVGRSTTKAVVLSSVSVLILDYFLTSWILEYL